MLLHLYLLVLGGFSKGKMSRFLLLDKTSPSLFDSSIVENDSIIQMQLELGLNDGVGLDYKEIIRGNKGNKVIKMS